MSYPIGYNYYPFSQNQGSWHTGPGISNIINLDTSDPKGDKAYFEELRFWTERGVPWCIRQHYGHYNPTDWNEENDSLVRDFDNRRKNHEDYKQFNLGLALV